jgi:hypothetical protein
MALFENYEGRMPQLQPVLDKYGFKSFEDVKAYTNSKGVDAYNIVESTQPICFETETWCVTEYLEPIIEKTIGYEALNNIFAGKATWNDPAIAGAVDAFQEMVKKGYFAADGLTLGNDQIKANFIARSLDR